MEITINTYVHLYRLGYELFGNFGIECEKIPSWEWGGVSSGANCIVTFDW